MSFVAFSEVQKYVKIKSFRGTPLGEFIALPRPLAGPPPRNPTPLLASSFGPLARSAVPPSKNCLKEAMQCKTDSYRMCVIGMPLFNSLTFARWRVDIHIRVSASDRPICLVVASWDGYGNRRVAMKFIAVSLSFSSLIILTTNSAIQ